MAPTKPLCALALCVSSLYVLCYIHVFELNLLCERISV
jgi:hypothetical protein